MPKRTSHPGVSVSKRKDGRYQLEWVPIGGTKRECTVIEVRNRRLAVKQAETLSQELAKAREQVEKLQADGTSALAQRWEIDKCLDDWLARPGIKAATASSDEFNTDLFRRFCRDGGLRFLDEVVFATCDHFRQHIDSQDWSAATKDRRLHAVRGFFHWCKGKLRVERNPFTVGHIEGFKGPKVRSRLRWIGPADRERLIFTCKTTQEKLLFTVTTYLGLRSAEAAHLRWGNYERNVDPPELDIVFSEPDANDPAGWDPKTGQRVVPIVWPEVKDLLDKWYAETPFGREANDPIFVDPTSGIRYRQLPVNFHRRLARETNIAWTYQVGRRVACALAVIHAERLTGRPWTQKEHEQIFGHRGDTAAEYYFDPFLPRRRREEFDHLDATSNAYREDVVEPHTSQPGLSVALAKRILRHLMKTAKSSPFALSKHDGLPSDVAIGKWLRKGNGVPSWFWTAMEVLTPKQTETITDEKSAPL